jgi:pimeloyl-ACP methyl ester carboxylesterase
MPIYRHNHPFSNFLLTGAVAADVFSHGQIKPKALIYFGASPYRGINGHLSPLCLESIGTFIRPDTLGSQAFAGLTKFVEAFTAPSRASSVPFPVKTSWIGTATQFPPTSALLAGTRQHDPTALMKAAKEGLPLCMIHGKEDLLVLLEPTLKVVQSLFTNYETHLLDGVGHVAFWEVPETVANIILTFVDRLSGSRPEGRPAWKDGTKLVVQSVTAVS